MKQRIAEMMGIETYKDDYKLLLKKNAYLEKQNVLLDMRINDLKKELEIYKASDEDKVKLIMEDARHVEELYQQRIKEADEMKRLAKADCDWAECEVARMSEKLHGAFADGRRAAYSELGIWNINAHTRGNILVRDEDGEVFEMIRGKLHDVDDDIDIEAAAVKIDDLLEGVDDE